MPIQTKFKTKGWETLFEEYLYENNEKYLLQKFKWVRKKAFRHAEQICPGCNTVYGLDHCEICRNPLDIIYSENIPLIKCKNCGETYMRGTCSNEKCGAQLDYFLIGNEKTMLRLAGLLFFSAEKKSDELRSTGFYKKVADISNVLSSLHYLDKKMNAIRRIVFPDYRFYMWKMEPKGDDICKTLLEYIDIAFGFGKYLIDFIDMRIEQSLEKEETLMSKEIIKGKTIRYTQEETEIENIDKERTIIHIKDKKKKI